MFPKSKEKGLTELEKHKRFSLKICKWSLLIQEVESLHTLITPTETQLMFRNLHLPPQGHRLRKFCRQVTPNPYGIANLHPESTVSENRVKGITSKMILWGEHNLNKLQDSKIKENYRPVSLMTRHTKKSHFKQSQIKFCHVQKLHQNQLQFILEM